MFAKSREKLKRLEKAKIAPRSYALEKRWKNERMSYETRMKLLKLERKLPVIRVYNADDYFPADQVARWCSKFVNFMVNAFFASFTILLIIILLMAMGPSKMMIECLVDPMTVMFEPYVEGNDYEQLQKCARTALVHDIFGLG